MKYHEKINYVEFPSKDLSLTKTFFSKVFGWTFKDFSCDYTAFSNQGLDGGFFKSDLEATVDKGSVLIVFYSANLEKTLNKIIEAGGKISQGIFSFPGGHRFHFKEPSGNEFAVWSDKTLD